MRKKRHSVRISAKGPESYLGQRIAAFKNHYKQQIDEADGVQGNSFIRMDGNLQGFCNISLQHFPGDCFRSVAAAGEICE